MCNTSVGPIEDLPFDVRGRRVASYSLDPESDEKPAEARSGLVKTLEFALRAILELHDAAGGRPRTASEALVEGMIAGSPGRRVLAAEYMAVFDSELASLQPPSAIEATVLIEALDASVEIVRGFYEVARHIALMNDRVVLEFLLRGLEPLANRCRASPRSGSSRFYNTDADFEFFTGQEVLLVLLAELIGVGAWELAKEVVETEFYVTNTRDGVPRHVGIQRFRDTVDKLDLHFGAGKFLSPVGKMLKERHDPDGVLGQHGSFERLANVDALLALRAAARQDNSWWPWTAPYWSGPPRCLLEAQSRANLKKLQMFLGVTSEEDVVHAVRDLAELLRKWIRLGFHGLEGFDPNSLASRD